MKLLHVHDFIAPGNSRYGLDLDRRLAARGHEVHLLAGVGEMGPEDGGALEGVPCHTYPYGFGLSPFEMYRYAVGRNRERFERLQRENGFDLVLFNQPLCAAGVLDSPLSRKVARAYSFISSWPEEWRIANPDAGFFRRFVHVRARVRLERRALKACRSVLVVSRFMLGRLKALHPRIPDGRLHLVPGAVDLDRFRPGGSKAENRRRLGLVETGTLLLTVRRLVPRMGIESLIDALPPLLRRHPDVSLVVGGDGPLRPALEKRAADLPVRFLGYVQDEQLPALYRAADVFVLPTRALEGFGLVAIEAMACGTPALGTPVGAIPEVLGADLLLPGTEPEAIAEGIARFLDAPPPADMRERVAKYDWKEVEAVAERALAAALEKGP
ncbi:MAG: glycosyltransferase family 4 protein [Planctomycetes bacterium]|nr:glycosyltransferase family 4 protein [Planctomycetota bacterium]